MSAGLPGPKKPSSPAVTCAMPPCSERGRGAAVPRAVHAERNAAVAEHGTPTVTPFPFLGLGNMQAAARNNAKFLGCHLHFSYLGTRKTDVERMCRPSRDARIPWLPTM